MLLNYPGHGPDSGGTNNSQSPGAPRNVPVTPTTHTTLPGAAGPEKSELGLGVPRPGESLSLATYYSYPVDVWSLGIVAYTITTGYPPFDSSLIQNNNPSDSPNPSPNPTELLESTMSNILGNDISFPPHMLEEDQTSLGAISVLECVPRPEYALLVEFITEALIKVCIISVD